ncbi:hypothetical protein KC325_g226 [Hortaea werneckii]|nr:hypothetical protein KC325_g226 [Hortaea werneckii]
MADTSQKSSLVKAVAKTEAILRKQVSLITCTGIQMIQEAKRAPNHYILHWKPDLLHAEAHADTTSRIVWRFCCPAEYRNPVGHVFGGAIATLLDVGTSLYRRAA